MIASILTVLMCMTLIPVINSGKVRADGPDTDDYISVNMYSYVWILDSGEPTTFKFKTDQPMTYRIYADEQVAKYSDYARNIPIDVYDLSGKLIKSSNCPDISVELEGDTYYYVVVGASEGFFQIRFSYDFDIEVKAKEPGKNSYGVELRNGDFWSGYYGGDWNYYTPVEDSDLKIDLVTGSLPDGMELDYSWTHDTTKDNHFQSIGTKNKTLEINAGKGKAEYYACNVTSKDGSFATRFIFEILPLPAFTFKNGKDYDYKIEALKPGEERKFKFPETVYGGDPDDEIKYALYGMFSGENMNVDEIPTAIPSDWKSIVVMCDERKGSTSVSYYIFSFLFEDGEGEKVKTGQTYHYKAQPDGEEFGQAIYSFTPEETGTYDLKVSKKLVSPQTIAVFDSGRNLIDESISAMFEDLYGGVPAENYDLKVDLTGGKTYYIALPVMYEKMEFDFSISMEKKIPEVPEVPDVTEVPEVPEIPEVPEEMSFSDFVERLYVVALNRQSEPEGKAFWCEHVGNGDLDGAQCAKEFLLSKEFNDRGLNDEQFLKVLYKTFFDRDAEKDPNGFNFWMNSLKTEGRDKVVDGFINSEEWCNICASYGVKSGATRAKATIASANATAFATRLYTECLGRDPEADGLKFWSLGLTNLELTGKQAAHEFFFSKEFNDFNLDNEGLLTRMYTTFMGRQPDEDGMNFWLNNMKSGMTKEEVFNEFVKSPEFTQICKDYAIERG